MALEAGFYSPYCVWECAGRTLCFLLGSRWPHRVVTLLHLKGVAFCHDRKEHEEYHGNRSVEDPAECPQGFLSPSIPTSHTASNRPVEQPFFISHKHTSRTFVVLACRMSEMKSFTIFLWHREAFLQLPFKSEIPSLNQFIPWPSQSFHSNALPSLIFPGWCRIPTLPSTA